MDRRHGFALVAVLLVLAAAGVSSIDGTANATERAMAQEETYLEAELANASCIDASGTYATTDRRRASVVEHQHDGTIVRVEHPYWYGTDDVEADALSEAVYLVSEDAVRLLRRAPLELPC